MQIPYFFFEELLSRKVQADAGQIHCAASIFWLTKHTAKREQDVLLLTKECFAAQLTFQKHSLLSHPTQSDAWRHVRKGVSPAFAMRNIKYVPLYAFSSLLLPHLYHFFFCNLHR